MSEKDTRIAKAVHGRPVPTLEQIHAVLSAMPGDGDIARRNRALLAFTLLRGARDGAIASLRLKHVDVAQRKVFQDARDVKTKFSKTFTTWFFPVGGNALEVVEDWVNFLRAGKLWGLDDPLFPATAVVNGASRTFDAAGFARRNWANATPIRTIFRESFAKQGLPNFNPHSFRHTLTQ
jgi:integrase/recombinase XerD